MYSAGVVLYYMLTGEMAFDKKDIDLSTITVPDQVLEQSRKPYLLTAAMLNLHTSWVSYFVNPLYS